VPIKHVATKELSLTTHEIDTFTGWTPPTPFDLIIAVSFGRLVPQRILNSTKYGGLNVHPSLLPDLRGPAPIHHTLLKRRTRTGVTVQTLHPQHFDQGLILAQTPPPGLDVPPGVTVEQLINRLGGVGGEMLVNVLKDGTFTLPIKDAGWYAESGGPVEHAEKITPLHRYIQFATSPAEDILTRHHVLGNLWFTLPNGERVILNETKALGHDHDPARRTGLFVSAESGSILARTADGQLLEIQSTTLAGGKKRMGNAQLRSMVARIEESRMQ
jgi:methionyl-tRNA formyltransferase